MATSLQSGRNGTIPQAKRIEWRLSYGDLPSLIRAAHEETANGQYRNAWSAYQCALTDWLYRSYLERLNKRESTIRDPFALVQKLRACGAIDHWQMEVLHLLLKTPKKISFEDLGILEAVLRSVTGEWGE